ncbi:hypothetical protein GCM10022242_32190 [Nocardioides panacisoli]|uniref:DUF3995 domain-containing protein n=2 Tax=Nocardioides panacisoli TaxID=627624 RepID=A0ABP7IX21_9ACTN
MTARRVQATVLALVITVLAVFGVAGHSRLSGPILWTINDTNGVHRDDLIVAGCWLVGIVICVLLGRSPRPPGDAGSGAASREE